MRTVNSSVRLLAFFGGAPSGARTRADLAARRSRARWLGAPAQRAPRFEKPAFFAQSRKCSAGMGFLLYAPPDSRTKRPRTRQVILEEGGANNIFSELTRAQFRDARQTIVKAILGTDMSSHMQHCADLFQFAQKAKRLRAGGGRGAAEGAAAAAATSSSIREGKGQGRSLPPRKRPKSAAAAAYGVPVRAGGGRGGAATLLAPLPPSPPSPPVPPATAPAPAHVFSVDRAEDRSFLTQTIVHWWVSVSHLFGLYTREWVGSMAYACVSRGCRQTPRPSERGRCLE